MKTDMRVVDPGKVEVALTVTMSLADWKRLRADLPAAYPGWKLAEAIGSAVRSVEQTFEGDSSSWDSPGPQPR